MQRRRVGVDGRDGGDDDVERREDDRDDGSVGVVDVGERVDDVDWDDDRGGQLDDGRPNGFGDGLLVPWLYLRWPRLLRAAGARRRRPLLAVQPLGSGLP